MICAEFSTTHLRLNDETNELNFWFVGLSAFSLSHSREPFFLPVALTPLVRQEEDGNLLECFSGQGQRHGHDGTVYLLSMGVHSFGTGLQLVGFKENFMLIAE